MMKSTSACADFMTMAERELSAFFNAVTRLFGPEQAELSAQDWLQELSKINDLPNPSRDLRAITTKVSTRLASRVSPAFLATESQTV